MKTCIFTKDEIDNADLTDISVDILEKNENGNNFFNQFYNLETYIKVNSFKVTFIHKLVCGSWYHPQPTLIYFRQPCLLYTPHNCIFYQIENARQARRRW